MQTNLLPETGFVRLSTILKVIPISKSTWWAGVKSGRYPKSIKLSKRWTPKIGELMSNVVYGMIRQRSYLIVPLLILRL